MGAEVSRAIRSDLENSNLIELLSNKKFVDRLREAVSVLDDNVLSSLSELLVRKPAIRPIIKPGRNSAKRRRISASVQHDICKEVAIAGPSTTTSGADAALVENLRTRQLWKLKKEQVALPSEIAESFGEWRADPTAFLRISSSQVPSSLKEYYDYALSMRISTISNTILWRFITTVYYDVISALSQSDRCSITKEAVAFAVAVICKSPSYDREKVEKNIIRWAKDGAKYRALANKLGGLCCYFFYPNISEWIWTKYLPQDSYDKAAKLLIEFGIFDKAKLSGAVELAQSIEKILKEPFQSAVAMSHGQGTMPRVLRSPSPPQGLLVTEELLHYIEIYFQDSCKNMIFDDHGALLDPNGAELRNDLCNDFDSYCFTATMFAEKKSYVESGRALSKAFALVQKILQAEHPRTLSCFLEVFIHLIQTGHLNVTLALCRSIKKISAKVTRKVGPWGQICQLLGELDSETLAQAMPRIWECTAVTLESKLGISSRFAMSIRLDYIKRVYGCTDYLEEERLLRLLLTGLRAGDRILAVPVPRVMLNLAHNLKKQERYDEAEKMAQEVLSLLENNKMYANRIVERIECMKIFSHCHFYQGKTREAELAIREAIGMIVAQWGTQHPWVLEFKTVLEGWFRHWGQEKDAKTVRGEIEQLMGKDEIDE